MEPLLALDRMAALGRVGFTISVCCGPSGASPFRWTVHVLLPDGQAFDRPFAADDFVHAIEIAEREIMKRGWHVPGYHPGSSGRDRGAA